MTQSGCTRQLKAKSLGHTRTYAYPWQSFMVRNFRFRRRAIGIPPHLIAVLANVSPHPVGVDKGSQLP
jgi:hypothetical protein